MGTDKKNHMVGAVCLNKQCERRELSFEEVLLDETLVQGEVWILKEALRSVGGINYRLGAKRNYELLIRIAKEYVVLQTGQQADAGMFQETGTEYLSEKEKVENWLRLQPEDEMTSDSGDVRMQEGLKTDCYLIGRYKAELLSMGCFDDAVLGIFSTGREDMIQYLEQMIGGKKEFYDLYDCTQPILIYRGSQLCHNLLNIFVRGLSHGLEELGQRVEYFDISKQQPKDQADYVRRRFKSVISMHTPVFSAKWENGRFLYDDVAAPKYFFFFDHPIWSKEDLEQVPKGLCVLTPDRNYARFVEDYYGHPARFLPPAGSQGFDTKERDYEIVFLGRYYGAELIQTLREAMSRDRKWGYLLNRYVLYMRKDLSEIPEHAFSRALEYYGITCTKREFTEKFYENRRVLLDITAYYRNRVIEVLLESGISLHVFGDTWKESPMWGHPGLIYHEEVSAEEALGIYGRAKFSLNIMTWHKDGFTERIANAMLQKSVVVTDRTTYLEENFVSGKDLLMFDLGHPEELPGQIRAVLDDEEKRKGIAENGYRKAVRYHTWRQRAGKILEFIEEDR